MTTLAVVELENVSGLSEDRFVNTWTIGSMSDATAGATVSAVAAAIATFYDDIASGLSSRIVRAGTPHSIKFFDIGSHLDGSPHGSPYAFSAWGIPTGGSGSDLPDEVAIAIRLEAFLRADQPAEAPDGSDAGSLPDRPRQRYTGHVYLGPLTTAAQGAGSASYRPNSAYLTTIRSAVNTMHDTMAALSGVTGLQVWSRADATTRLVEFVATDDAFDTQRRRGVAPTGVTRLAI